MPEELKRVKIDGRWALIAYLDEDFNPVEPEQAKMMKILYDNGDTVWAAPRKWGQQGGTAAGQ